MSVERYNGLCSLSWVMSDCCRIVFGWLLVMIVLFCMIISWLIGCCNMFLMWCLIMMMVRFCVWVSWLMSVIEVLFDVGLRFVSGLLNNRILLLLIRILVMVICCFCLLDNFCGWWVNKFWRFKVWVYCLVVCCMVGWVCWLFFNEKVIFLMIVKLMNWLLGFCSIVLMFWDNVKMEFLVMVWLVIFVWFVIVFG